MAPARSPDRISSEPSTRTPSRLGVLARLPPAVCGVLLGAERLLPRARLPGRGCNRGLLMPAGVDGEVFVGAPVNGAQHVRRLVDRC